jgi:hypothetical protein
MKVYWETVVTMFWMIFLAALGSSLAVFILQEIMGVFYV